MNDRSANKQIAEIIKERGSTSSVTIEKVLPDIHRPHYDSVIDEHSRRHDSLDGAYGKVTSRGRKSPRKQAASSSVVNLSKPLKDSTILFTSALDS